MLNGMVVWYNRVKGYGFIKSETGSEYFVHYSLLGKKDGKEIILKSDQKVMIEVDENKRKVTKIEII